MRSHLTLRRPDQLHAIGDPTRWRILGRLNDGPASIQELSRTLAAAKGRIGHHVRVLEEAGLIRLAETQRVRGVTEKRYARVAKQFRLPESIDGDEAAQADLALLPLRTAISEVRPSRGKDDPTSGIVVRARMSAERAHRFAKLVNELAAEFADGAPGTGETFGFIGAIYVPDWADRAPDGAPPTTTKAE